MPKQAIGLLCTSDYLKGSKKITITVSDRTVNFLLYLLRNSLLFKLSLLYQVLQVIYATFFFSLRPQNLSYCPWH